MLVITVDLVPGGFAPMRRTITAMNISNTSDLAEISAYSDRGERDQQSACGYSAAYRSMRHPRTRSRAIGMGSPGEGFGGDHEDGTLATSGKSPSGLPAAGPISFVIGRIGTMSRSRPDVGGPLYCSR